MRFRRTRHENFILNAVFQLLDVGNQPYRKTLTKPPQNVHNRFDKLFVEGAKPLVEEEKFDRAQGFLTNRRR